MQSQTNLKVDNIRPDALKELRNAAERKDSAWIESHRHTFTVSNCPVCGPHASSQKDDIIVTRGNDTYARCHLCKTLYMSPCAHENVYHEYYNVSEVMKLFAEYIFPLSQDARMNAIYMPRLRRMSGYYTKYSSKKGVYLEIGAGSGVFTNLVKLENLFEDCVAVEPSPSLSKSCRAKGLTTIEQPFENIHDFTKDIALVTFFEGLEHLVDPRKILE